MNKKWTIDSVKELFSSRGCELLETEYYNTKTKMRYIASCGHEHEITLDNFRANKGDLCKACKYIDIAKKESVSRDTILQYFESEGAKIISISGEGSSSRVKYIAKCGHENIIDYDHFKSQKSGRICNKCSKSIRYEYDFVKESFENKDCELLETEYINSKTPMRYIAQCGHESTITFDVFINAKNASLRCRKCHKHTYHEIPIDRNKTASKVWRKKVYERDGYNCVVCGKHGGDLNAHHLEAYDSNAELRFSVDNGVTLCPDCHILFHKAYGFGGNTKEQFDEWVKVIPR